MYPTAVGPVTTLRRTELQPSTIDQLQPQEVRRKAYTAVILETTSLLVPVTAILRDIKNGTLVRDRYVPNGFARL